MRDQGNAMRSGGMAGPGLRRYDRLDDIQMAQHRRREDVDPRASGDEEAGDVAPPHMGGGSKARLPIAAAPIPGRIEARRMVFEERGDLLRIRMRYVDEIL